jgi:aryl-alcohol dehydrogenase-like predicted oxidoreductase
VLGAARAKEVKLITRVVDYGGVFHDDVKTDAEFAAWDHRKFRPDGWVQRGLEKLERMRPYAQRHGLTMLQLACAWNLAQTAVECVAPTLIQEAGVGARAIEEQRAELAALPVQPGLSESEVAELRAIGDNRGSMALKGASADFAGEGQADRWSLSAELAELAERWEIEPVRDLTMTVAAR